MSMKSKYVLQVIEDYEKLQEEAKNLQKRKQTEIYNKIPSIKLIDDEIYKIGIEIASSIFKGIDIESYISEQKKKILDLKIKKGELLSQHNYPVDYLEIKYKCSDCNDTGYINNTKCHCFKQKLINLCYLQSNLKNILEKENFENFNFDFYSTKVDSEEGISPLKNIQHIYSRCIDFVDNFNSSNENLFFYGSAGLGKTFLSNCIAKDILDRGKTVIYQTASNLMKILVKNAMGDNTKNEEIDDLINCDLLIIDDLGTEPNTAYSGNELFNIINSRILKGKKMVISTNYLLAEILDKYPERVASRIIGCFTLFKFFGKDIRLIKKEQEITNKKKNIQ